MVWEGLKGIRSASLEISGHRPSPKQLVTEPLATNDSRCAIQFKVRVVSHTCQLSTKSRRGQHVIMQDHPLYYYGLGLGGFSGIFPPMLFSTKQGAKVEAVSGDAWFKPSWFVTLLAALTLASFPQVFLGSQTFIYKDFGVFSYPIAYHLRESFWHGEIPLWNPLNNCGVPFLAQWNTQALYPPTLFYLLFPLSWSLGVFCLLHLFLGGWGMCLLAHEWTKNRFAAAFAGIVFSFNGLMLNSLMWPAFIAGLGWMPWVVWLTERAWRDGERNGGGGGLRGCVTNAFRRSGSCFVNLAFARHPGLLRIHPR